MISGLETFLASYVSNVVRNDLELCYQLSALSRKEPKPGLL